MERWPIVFGFQEEWRAFADSHREFFARFDNLRELLKKVFIRTGTTASRADLVIFFLGRLAVEDFMEILLLCANGYGLAGLKLLRGMYEKCVTGGYLSLHPAEAESFLDFHRVQEWKLHQAYIETYKDQEAVSRELAEKMEAEFRRVKPKFEKPLCKACGTTTMQLSWSRLDTLSMALKVGNGMSKLYMSCYLVPTLQIHATPSAVFTRLKATSEEGLNFDKDSQRSWAGTVLISAHTLLLYMIGLQIRHFGLDLEQHEQQVISDFRQTWGNNPGDVNPPGILRT